MADVFVSYASEDRDRIRPLIDAIAAEGLSVWWDRHIGMGSSFDREIERELDAASCVVVVWSENSVDSDWVRDEAQEGYDRGILVPVRIDDVKPPLGFRRAQTADLVGWPVSSAEIEPFLDSIRTGVGSDVIRSKTSEPDSQMKSMAVLPFVNMSNDPEQEFFSDGISEDILNELAKGVELTVRPRSSSFSLKGESLDIQSIGKRLNVTHVLEGSVRRSGERIRVTAQLSEVITNRSVWSERYDRDLTDIFEVQDEIAAAISNAVNVQFGGAPTREFVNSAAYTAFLRGRHYRQRGEIEAAEEWLKTAVELHPSNADAWYELAYIQINQHGLGRVAKDARLEYLNKVLAIDPAHPGALADRAYQETHLVQHDYQRAINELVRLIRAHPNHEAPLSWLSMVLLGVGRDDLASRLSSRLSELSPLSHGSGNLMMVALLSNDLERAKSALATFTQAGGVNPYYAIQVAMAERDADKLEAIKGDSLPDIEGFGDFFRTIASAYAMYLRGEFDALRQVTQTWQGPAGYQSFYSRWIPSLLERDLDSAFEHYRAALVAGEPIATQWVRGLIGDRVLFAEFYADPRYQQMLEEFGLDAESTSKIVVPELPF